MTRISLRDVGPRDGLQAASAFLPTEKKIEWFRLAAAAGVPDIEVTSFSSPRLLPQFADAPEVLPAAMAMGGFGVSALIPNRKGAERGFALKAPKLNYVVSASNAHSLSNGGRSTADAVGEFGEIVGAVGDAQPRRLGIRIGFVLPQDRRETQGVARRIHSQDGWILVGETGVVAHAPTRLASFAFNRSTSSVAIR